jgi:hypothetical protein
LGQQKEKLNRELIQNHHGWLFVSRING